jgi:hypothetical protein
MNVNKWWSALFGVALGVILIFGFLLLVVPERALAWERLDTVQPGVAISPGSSALVENGDVVVYLHTITNTGLVAGLYSIQASASERWDVDYFTMQYPGGTTVMMPFALGAGEVVTVGVRLTVPALVRPGVVNTTTVTATVLVDGQPYAHALAYDVATVIRHLYLPLIFNNYDPFVNGDFVNGLYSWAPSGQLGVALDLDPDQPTNVVARLGNPAFACTNVPIGLAGLTQSFVAPLAPADKSMHILFRYRIYSNDQNVTLSSSYDSFDVRVNGELKLRDANQGAFNDCNVPPYDLGWKYGDINLGAGGAPVLLSFEVYNRLDKNYNTYVLIDDVRVLATD